MDRITTRLRTALLVGGLGLAAFAAEPAAAQFACPLGYYYDPVYGCVLPHDGYLAPNFDYVPPAYGWFGYPHVRGWDHGWHDHGEHGGGRGPEHGRR